MEKQIGTIKGHRVIIERDLNDGKAISYKVAEFVSVSDFEKLQIEVAMKQKAMKEEQAIERAKFEEEEKLRAYEKEEIERQERYDQKYSLEHFLMCHNAIQHKILVGLVEDDGSFPLLLDNVLNGALSVEEAINSNEALGELFYNIFGLEEGEE